MSEVDIDVTGEQPAQPAPRTDFGARLAAARERRGWSVNEVASRVRLSPKQVSALERLALEELPGPVFVRGFLRTYAREVGLDPAPLLDEYNALVGGAPVARPQETPQTSSPVFRAAAREHYVRPVVLGGALILLLALGVIGAVAMRKPASPAATVPAASPAPATAPQPAPAPTPAPATADAGKPGSPSGEAAQEPPPANVSAPIAAATEPGAAPTVSVPAAPAATATESAIRLTFAEVSWVEVLDASGKQLLSQNNPAGSEVRLDGKAPFQVLIGNAGGTRLEYRGKPIELGPMTSRDNVARVKLN